MAKHCGSSCSTSDCKKKRDCACMCGPLQASDFQLKDGCVEACNGPIDQIPTSIDDYLCRFVGGDELFSKYGLIRCGFDFRDSAQFQAKREDNKLQDFAIKLFLALIVIILLYLIIKK